MLNKIPAIISPELMKVMMEMGHGDELLIADGNYPKLGQPERCVRMDGHSIPEILEAILPFFPLDGYVEKPVTLMAILPDDPYVPEIWDQYRGVMKELTVSKDIMQSINKYEFYKQGAKAYAVVTTSESALYANIILKKGVVK